MVEFDRDFDKERCVDQKRMKELLNDYSTGKTKQVECRNYGKGVSKRKE